MSDELTEHKCPIEGKMMIEKDKPCNWCGRIESELKLIKNPNYPSVGKIK